MQKSYGIDKLLATYQIDSGCKTGGKDGKEGKEGKDDGVYSHTAFDFAVAALLK